MDGQQTLPAMKLGTDEWEMPEHMAVKLLLKLWELDVGESFTTLLGCAMTNRPARLPETIWKRKPGQ